MNHYLLHICCVFSCCSVVIVVVIVINNIIFFIMAISIKLIVCIVSANTTNMCTEGICVNGGICFNNESSTFTCICLIDIHGRYIRFCEHESCKRARHTPELS